MYYNCCCTRTRVARARSTHTYICSRTHTHSHMHTCTHAGNNTDTTHIEQPLHFAYDSVIIFSILFTLHHYRLIAFDVSVFASSQNTYCCTVNGKILSITKHQAYMCLPDNAYSSWYFWAEHLFIDSVRTQRLPNTFKPWISFSWYNIFLPAVPNLSFVCMRTFWMVVNHQWKINKAISTVLTFSSVLPSLFYESTDLRHVPALSHTVCAS